MVKSISLSRRVSIWRHKILVRNNYQPQVTFLPDRNRILPVLWVRELLVGDYLLWPADFSLPGMPLIRGQPLDVLLNAAKQVFFSGILNMILESLHLFMDRCVIPLIKNQRQGRVPVIIAAISVRQHFPEFMPLVLLRTNTTFGADILQ